jgi:hypothetical protein
VDIPYKISKGIGLGLSTLIPIKIYFLLKKELGLKDNLLVRDKDSLLYYLAKFDIK